MRLFYLINRWRVNSREFAVPLSKKGLLRGYIKYGFFAYVGWFHLRKMLTPAPAHHGGGHH